MTLVETIAIVVVVLFLFLGSLRTVLVPLAAIPLSLLGAVAMMSALGFTLNLLTLLAIVLSVGLVVDDAIVVVENVDRTIREGKGRVQAALLASRELVGPVIAMTITLAAVYAPIGLQGGLTGALFREFAFTLACAVFISGVVALTLSPMMSASILDDGRERGWLGRATDAAFGWIQRTYLRVLDWTLARRWVILLSWAVVVAAVVPMYLMSPTELAPTEDQGYIFVAVDLPPNSTIGQVTTQMAEVESVFKSLPEYGESFGVLTPQFAFGGVALKAWDQRARTSGEAYGQLAGGLAGLPAVRATPFLPSPLPSAGNFPVDVLLVGAVGHNDLLAAAYDVQQRVMKTGHFAFPPLLDLKVDQTQAEIQLDRELLSALGMTAGQVGLELGVMTSGADVGRFERDGRAYKVIPMVERSARLVPEQLMDIQIAAAPEATLPLGAVASVGYQVAPRSLNRFSQLNAVRLSGVPTRSLGEALAAIEQAASHHEGTGIHLEYAGESRQLKQEAGKFLPAMSFAILLIFFVLAAQFNSFRDPAVILLGSVPLAMFGALIFTFLKFSGPPGASFELTDGWTTTLNIYSQVGLVTLVGLVAKNGILLVEFANVAQERGLSKLDAVRAAARTRLRPIMMTTAATVFGHFPLTLISGPGAEARNSVGLILVGGMAVGTVFTLLFLPSLYVVFARKRSTETTVDKTPHRDVLPAAAHPAGG